MEREKYYKSSYKPSVASSPFFPLRGIVPHPPSVVGLKPKASKLAKKHGYSPYLVFAFALGKREYDVGVRVGSVGVCDVVGNVIT